MSRILSIDFGRKRVGIAVSDPLQIIANSLKCVQTKDIWIFLDSYLTEEEVECIVVGNPKQLNNQPSESIEFVKPFYNKLKKKYPNIAIELMDERFTSKMAVQAMIDGGLKKKSRQNKALVDTISATIILQSYLDYIKFKQNLK